MREAFHHELHRLSRQLQAMCWLAGDIMVTATSALVDTDLRLSERAIGHVGELQAMFREVDRATYAVLALQAPVAGELRTVVSMIHISENLRRMGELARHIAQAARRRHPETAIPVQLREGFAEMGLLCQEITAVLSTAIGAPNSGCVIQLERLDDRLDELEIQILSWITDPAQPVDVRAGVNAALVVRFYERYGDQAVNAARRVHFIATGEHYLPTTTP